MLVSDLLETVPYPDELINLYNPAYVASIVYLGGRAFEEKSKRGLPIFFPYVVFPLVAIDELRARLPQRTGKLTDWARQHGDVLFDFPERVVALRPFVSSALIYLRSHSLMTLVSGDAAFHFAQNKTLMEALEKAVLSSETVRDELDRAAPAGRLLSAEGDVSSVLATFGLKP